MKAHVKLFAILKEKAGTPELILDLPESSTVADLLREMDRLHPGLVAGIGQAPVQIMVAVNTEYATESQTLKDGDEVALIPPVSGGETSAPRPGDYGATAFREWGSPLNQMPRGKR